MLQRVLRVLEYNKIKSQLERFASSTLGKEKVQSLEPSFDFHVVKTEQDKTDEARDVIRLKGHVPLGGIHDIRPSLKRAQIGALLNEAEFLDIASTVYGGRQFKKFIEALLDEDVNFVYLANYAEQITPHLALEQNIRQCIDENGRVLDSASEALRQIRQTLRLNERKIREKLDQIVRSSQKMLSDAIITIRNDRYVLPVKQEYRHVFKGMVHDQSSSGATLFIEPQSIVELNHKIQEAKVKEKAEIEKILLQLTRLVAGEVDSLLVNVDVLSEVDFVFAKAHYADAISATKPIINDEGIIDLKKARHPLIDPKRVVPLSIELGQEFSSIVVTGPNTGGKTVALKTVGLITLMAQSGLQIPAQEESKVAVFESIFADIGDEQSIEQSLSTFSSHMTNIVQILRAFDSKSLLLFDELGAGTDPEEGAALAIAILDYCLAHGARLMATTHYSELKAYAYNRQGVINASVEFDVKTLKPTYRLLIGVPGKSNAFEISKRLGLDELIIDKAKEQISTDHNKVNQMIISLEEMQKQAERDRNDAKKWRAEAKELQMTLQHQVEQFEDEKEQLLKEAEQNAREAVEKAKEEAKQIIAHLRHMQLLGQHVKEHELIEAKTRLDQAVPTLHKKKAKGKAKKQNEGKLKPGDEVKVLSFGQKGFVVEAAGDNEYQVQIGILKMKVSRDDLQLLESKSPVETKPLAAVKGSNHHVKLELDLRGERYEDALMRVEKYLDDAILAGYPMVYIIHGKGTGALRKGVHSYLKQHSRVKSFRLGGMSEGGSGVTVVEFK